MGRKFDEAWLNLPSSLLRMSDTAKCPFSTVECNLNASRAPGRLINR